MDVKKVIKDKGWTIEQLAAALPNRSGGHGVSPVTLHQNLSRNPTVETLRKIADVIGCKVGDFFADETSTATKEGYPLTCPRCGCKLDIDIKEKE